MVGSELKVGCDAVSMELPVDTLGIVESSESTK